MRTAFVPLPCSSPNGAFPFMPFRPRWMAGLDLHDRGVFSALLEISWCEAPPCYLPGSPDRLRQMLRARYSHKSWDQPISSAVLSRFQLDPATGRLFFPPLLSAYRFMTGGDPCDVFLICEA